MKKYILPLVLLSLPLGSCTTSSKNSLTAADQVVSQAKLTQGMAATRSQSIKNPVYDLQLTVSPEGDFFSGQAVSDFEIVQMLSSNLLIDFQKGRVISLSVNGKSIANIIYQDQKIEISPNLLKLGANHIEIVFEGAYSKEGSGLYRFKDPEDQRVYMYTDFEPYQASQLFPCFDQPDLKAEIKMQVTVPKKWKVISTMRELEIVRKDDQQVTWKFPKTPKLSTYVFSMHAGPYHEWKSQAGSIPLRLFARESLAKYVNADEWFETTRKGFSFYQKYFSYAYPFQKYDQIIVPDFNWGGMENIAAVTYTEGFISRGVKTQNEKEKLANVILHEMAHMWFGDLVTMKWWNDLWLNESFASYMATHSMNEATSIKNSWISFFADDKSWGYWEDQLVTTHPIEGDVPDTAQALANFDGISYGKGASVLKQLIFFVGPEKFQAGVAAYFKKYQYSNAERKDFIDSLAQVAGLDLASWSKLWLTKAGVDQIKPIWTCQNGKISSFTLEKTNPPGETENRAHRTQMGLYQKRGEDVVLTKKVAVSYQLAQTDVKELIGAACPLMVNPNEGDHDFVVSILDSLTVKNLKTSISLVRDPLARMMFWSSLYDMVLKAKLSVQEFSQLYLKELPQEKHPYLRKKLLRSFASKLPYYHAAETDRKALNEKLEVMLWNFVSQAMPGSDAQKEYLDAFISQTQTANAQQKLEQLLTQKLKLPQFKIDQDRRWRMIQQLMANGHVQAEKLLTDEKKLDTSERGQQSALSIEAARGGQPNKTAFFEKIVSDQTDLTQSRIRAILYGLFPQQQENLRKEFSARFYKHLDQMLGHRSDPFLESYVSTVSPFACDMKSVNDAKYFLKTHENIPPVVLKSLRISIQETERCVKIRELSASPLLLTKTR